MEQVRKNIEEISGRAHLTMHPHDNVTTILDDRSDLTSLIGGGVVSPGLSYGHKVALKDIAKGADIIKYNIAIGRATKDIKAGEHVHIHNCR